MNISTWCELLHDYQDSVVCDVLEFGWPVGFVPTTLPVLGSLDSSRCPFDALPFTDGFVVSPLNTVSKQDSAERRVIVDLTWPCGTSVNDGIPSDSFLSKPISLSYPTIDSIVDAVISLGPGCLLYKRDLKKTSSVSSRS